MLSATCHCGAVRLVLPARPEKATQCNCSLCRRVGGLWSYFDVGTVRIEGHPEHTEAYVWGDRTLRTVRCRHCGCVTHWEPMEGKSEGRMAVNIRHFEPEAIGPVQVRSFDGADAWRYLE